MKRLCCSSLFFILLFGASLFASLHDKSAIIYLGEKISYPMVGIHDYIIVDPDKTDVYTHGFDLYKKKMYAQITITRNSTPKQLLEQIQNLQTKGFSNFYIKASKKTDVQTTSLLNTLSSRSGFQNMHILLHPSSSLDLSQVANTFEGLVLYNALKSSYLEQTVAKLKHYCDTIIDIETTTSSLTPKERISRLKRLGVIGYITNHAQDIYGYGVKNALKREILTLVSPQGRSIHILPAHQIGAVPLEYQGYIQSLYDVSQGLPDPDHLTQYAGVVIWLDRDYKYPDKLISWITEVQKHNIYTAFAGSFGISDTLFLQQLGIDAYDGEEGVTKKPIYQDPMMNFEINAAIPNDTLYFTAPKNSKELFSYQDTNGEKSTTAAITPWGGYALYDSFIAEIGDENLWVINPFEYFREALRLKPLPVPDPTSENGSRLFFSHVDGDGYISYAEFDPEKLAGEVIYEEIFKKFDVPHSASVIGAEVMPNGLYPELSKRCIEGLKKIYALPNVEPATHTFTHTFFWGKIKNGNLPPKYRLAPKGYEYNLTYEIKGMLDYINNNLLKPHAEKKATTVFWSGDCAPRLNALSLVYKYHILNLNGGDTTINNSEPWLTLVAPLGIARGEYYQIYAGEQNENVFTHDWLGPFWGFKKVIQTFKLTDKPRRLKPIDIYYHFYSGSKKASLNALRYVFNWVLKQPDIMPIFTSSYIPKAMDYYSVSLANEEDEWFVCGMRDLKNLRLETKKQHIDYKHSPSIVGEKEINNRTYLALSPTQKHFFTLTNKQQNETYLVNANAKLEKVIKGNQTTRYIFKGEVDLRLTYHLTEGCELKTDPKAKILRKQNETIVLQFPPKTHQGSVDVRCR